MQFSKQELIDNIRAAATQIKAVVFESPLSRNEQMSSSYDANILFKREDLQQVRSYKIRGAFNKISSLSASECSRGVVCASAGNHAQGVAYSCQHKKVRGVVFMPIPTPAQKIEQVKMFGGDFIEVRLVGDTFDGALKSALKYCDQMNMSFIHAFDDVKVIEGQGTVGLEILEQSEEQIDYLFLPVGGGGLAAGVSTVFKHFSPKTVIVGVEPKGAPSMSTSLERNENIRLEKIDNFVDGAAVQMVGQLNFDLCKNQLDEMAIVHEGKICQTIIELYNKSAIVVEPAGALSCAVLDQYKDEIKGKNVVCLVSGSNNDITRTEEIRERSILYKGLKHYFVIRFPQRAGALREFLTEVLGPKDDITHFEYSKKHNRVSGPAVVGIELSEASDFESLKQRMTDRKYFGEYLNDKPDLFQYLI